jgi:ribulose-phosphate 3-epimerase
MVSQIVPALTVETLDQYRAEVERITPFARRVHIDISDGEFAPTFLLQEANLYWPPSWEVDLHAMVTRPSEHMPTILQLKPSLVIFHAEVQEDLLAHFAQLKQAGIRTGVALLKTTVPSTVQQIIQAADHVMIFSGELGQHGGVASMMQLEKVRLVRKIKPDIEIGWDGGVNLENTYTLTQGSVDVLNVGGTIASAENPAEMYNELVKETTKRGVI